MWSVEIVTGTDIYQNSGENRVVLWEGTAEYIADGSEEIRPVDALMEKFVMAVHPFYSGFFCYCPLFSVLIVQKNTSRFGATAIHK